MQSTTWFTNFSKNTDAPYRLFAFSFAGGGASVYGQWPAQLPGVEVVALCLPGREARMYEPSFVSMEALVEQLLPQIVPLLDRPFSFFGHSMGALTAYALTRALIKAGLPQPDKLLLGAFRPPQLARRPMLHGLPDADLLRELIGYGGMPANLLASPELLGMVLPVLRADFSVMETTRFAEPLLLDCPIAAYCGADDVVAPNADMRSWGDLTRGAFALTEIEGGHFFLKSAQDQLLRLVDGELEHRHALDAADLRSCV